MVFGGNDEIPTPLNLENSTCDRQIWPDGSLFELIMLDGPAEDLTEEQRQAFIDRHPIKAQHVCTVKRIKALLQRIVRLGYPQQIPT